MARIMVNDGENEFVNHGSYIDIGMLQSYVEYRWISQGQEWWDGDDGWWTLIADNGKFHECDREHIQHSVAADVE